MFVKCHAVNSYRLMLQHVCTSKEVANRNKGVHSHTCQCCRSCAQAVSAAFALQAPAHCAGTRRLRGNRGVQAPATVLSPPTKGTPRSAVGRTWAIPRLQRR